MWYRDSEDSAPAEFPPEQPGVDDQEDDGELYGVEEAAHEDAVAAIEGEGEVVQTGAAAAETEDVEMGGADDTAGPLLKDDEGAESEDLEAESSGESDEEDDGEDEEGAADAEMGDAAPTAPTAPAAAAPQ